MGWGCGAALRSTEVAPSLNDIDVLSAIMGADVHTRRAPQWLFMCKKKQTLGPAERDASRQQTLFDLTDISGFFWKTTRKEKNKQTPDRVMKDSKEELRKQGASQTFQAPTIQR